MKDIIGLCRMYCVIPNLQQYLLAFMCDNKTVVNFYRETTENLFKNLIITKQSKV